MGTLGNQIQKGGMLEEKGGININSLKNNKRTQLSPTSSCFIGLGCWVLKIYETGPFLYIFTREGKVMWL